MKNEVNNTLKFKKAYLEISNICNLKCSFCVGTKREQKSLNLEEFTILANKIRPFSDYLYLHVMGEPLLHPHLTEFLEIANSLKFKVIITTNGTLLDRKIEILEQSEALHKINISLHAFEANSGIDGDLYVRSCAVYAKKLCENGKIVNLRLWNLGDGLHNENENILKILHEVFTGNWSENRSGFKLDNKVYLEWGEKFDWPDIESEEMGESCFCYALRNQIAVLSDGTVVPCCLDHDGNLGLGNLFKEDLQKILQNPRAMQIYDGFSKRQAVEKLCKTCGYARKFT